MVELSAGAHLAWQIAAGETALARQQYIEKEQIFIGICSLEKVLIPGAFKELDPRMMQALQKENDEIEDFFRDFELEQAKIRRAIREHVGVGDYTHKEKVVHRSEACKEYFKNAEKIAKNQGFSQVKCLHLMAAILKKPGSHIKEVLEGFGVKPDDIRKVIFRKKEPAEIKKEEPKTYLLDRYGTDLTRLAKEGKMNFFR